MDTVPLGKRIINGLHGNGVGAEPVDEGRSSHTRLVRGVRLLQSPSEWTEDTEDGLSPPESPGPGDLALRPLERPLPFEDFPPPCEKQSSARPSADMLEPIALAALVRSSA